MSTRFRGVHNPMKYVVYDIIESQAGAGALFIGAAVDVNECSSCLRHFVVEGVAVVGGTVVSALGKGNAV